MLNDPNLFRFTGGTAPTLTELDDRYARWVSGGSADEPWLNWIVRERCSGAAVGWVQATVTAGRGQPVAALAWTIGTRHQGRGFAREAAAKVVEQLGAAGVQRFVARIHPGHVASIRMAESIGLVPTERVDDGEVVWRSVGPTA